MEANIDPHGQNDAGRKRDLEHPARIDVYIKPFPSALEKPQGRRGRKNIRDISHGGHQNKAFSTNMRKDHKNSQRIKQHPQGLHRSTPGSLLIYYDMNFLFSICKGFPNVLMERPLIFVNSLSLSCKPKM